MQKIDENSWLYLSDDIIKDKLTFNRGKDSLQNFYTRILIPNYQLNVDYKKVTREHELVKLYFLSMANEKLVSNNKKYYIVTLKTMNSLLSRRQFKKAPNQPERIISNRLAKELNGKQEVMISNGKRIDILTDDCIIEVKNDKNKLDAIGQILYYSKFYKDKKKRIHLFDHNYIDDIYEGLCKSLDIIVTYEN